MSDSPTAQTEHNYKKECVLFATSGLFGALIVWSMFSIAGFSFEYSKMSQHGLYEPMIFMLESGIVIIGSALVIVSVASIIYEVATRNRVRR